MMWWTEERKTLAYIILSTEERQRKMLTFFLLTIFIIIFCRHTERKKKMPLFFSIERSVSALHMSRSLSSVPVCRCLSSAVFVNNNNNTAVHTTRDLRSYAEFKINRIIWFDYYLRITASARNVTSTYLYREKIYCFFAFSWTHFHHIQHHYLLVLLLWFRLYNVCNARMELNISNACAV